MKKSRTELNKYIENVLRKNVKNAKFQRNIFETLTMQHNISNEDISDLVTLRRGIIEFSDFYAFALLEVFDQNLIQTYFTDIEINNFSNYKVSVDKIKMPYKLNNMVEVVPYEQWIGSITVKELMKLKPIIRYNENAQRTLQRVVANDSEYYRIYINKHAISEIREGFRNKTRIPDTITLNIPETAVFDYRDNSLVFKELENFDIIDGYHRFVAMSQEYDIDKSFDDIMELRVVMFDESKARQFIFQEDQKTKMKRVDSDSLNQYDVSNRIVQKLNEISAFRGLINRNGIINSADFAMILRLSYFYKLSKSAENSKRLEVQRRLVSILEDFADYNPEYLTNRWSTVDILFFVCLTTTNIHVSKYADILKQYQEYKIPTLKRGVINDALKKVGDLDV